MAIYPVEFYRRAEEKWKLRYASSRATPAEQPAPKKDGTDDVLTRWPWLGAIGQTPVSVRRPATSAETSRGAPEEAIIVRSLTTHHKVVPAAGRAPKRIAL